MSVPHVWHLNTIGNTASKTNGEMAWVEGNNDTEQYDIIHESDGIKTVVDSAETDREARVKLKEFISQ